MTVDRPSPRFPSRPRHRNPTARDRTAHAPYNFVPLPEAVVVAVSDPTGLPGHDTYANADYPNTGHFDVTITTRSPLYVRCGLPRDLFDRQGSGEDGQADFRNRVKNTPDFFYTRRPDEPVVPGSSLRGMLRNLLEIVSYGKLERITDRHLFFRSVDNSALGDDYRARMVGTDRNQRGENKVESGFLRRTSRGTVIAVAQKLQVRRGDLSPSLLIGSGPNAVPNWAQQHRRIFVRVAPDGRHVDASSLEPRPGLTEGRLVITGPAPRKAHEFVFLLPLAEAEHIAVPEELIQRFEDDDQVTQWQERAFPKDRPEAGSRARDGALQKTGDDLGEPVFFLREDDPESHQRKLTFFGRAGLFRLPYLHAPSDLVPEALRRPEDVDDAEAIFGWVGKPGNLTARAGRVSVTDARLIHGQGDVWLAPEAIVPKILAGPKPTAFQHYLVQAEELKDRLRHYDDPLSRTTIRGHKLYWHQGERQRSDLEASAETVTAGSTQHTLMKPVRAGVTFRSRIYFENLSDRELGALCWVLQPLGDPSRTYCHGLGMGKSLGMGAVQLAAKLHLTDRRQRYARLFAGEGWETGETAEGEDLGERTTIERRVAPFEQPVLAALGLGPTCQHLFQLKRIAMLLKLLEWPGLPPAGTATAPDPRSDARPMTIEEFKRRPVLPNPSAFGDLTGMVEPPTGPLD
ncbi:MAG: TIGR03986 family type III CRISPR-associated RAMP protein, partial [Chloroflexota bacterium]